MNAGKILHSFNIFNGLVAARRHRSSTPLLAMKFVMLNQACRRGLGKSAFAPDARRPVVARWLLLGPLSP